MPPKKDTKKQELISEDDGSGMPKQIVQFKWEFEVTHNNLQNMVIMFEWFTSPSQLERTDTGLVEAWAIKNADNPNTLIFEKVYDPFRMEEETVRTLCSKKFYIYLVNSDDMKVKEEILVDLSCLVSDRREFPDFVYENSRMKTIEIEMLRVRISADKCLLQQSFREYLNPLEITIIGAKDIPMNNNNNRFEPVYVSYIFFDGLVVQSSSLPHSSRLRWDYKHVHLIGSLDQAKLLELLATKPFKVQLHDRDELLDTSLRVEQELFDIAGWLKAEDERNRPIETNEVDPKKKGVVKKEVVVAPKKEVPKKEAKKKEIKLGEPVKEVEVIREYNRNNYGLAGFFLSDLLKPNLRTTKLQAAVVPRKVYEDSESHNLQLNTTAQRNLPKKLNSASYMEYNTLLLIGIDISIGIGQLKIPPRIEPIEVVVQEKKGAKRERGKEKEVKAMDPIPSQEGLPPIFERAVFIMPYKQREWVQRIQDLFYQVNMTCFPQSEGGVRALTTKALDESERSSRTLDYLSGFQVLDNDIRVVVLEGLSAGAMKLLGDTMIREAPNTEVLKILKNPDVLFKERMYTDFNVEIKRVFLFYYIDQILNIIYIQIRLRENLQILLMNPDLYIRTKVPENIQDTLVKISNMLRQWNIRTVAQFNLFPLSVDLVGIERKYSDSLTHEDINGRQASPKQMKNRVDKQNTSNMSDPNRTLSQTVKFQEQNTIVKTQEPTLIGLKSSIKINNPPEEQYTLQMRTYRDAAVRSAYVYSGQKNNDVEQQVRDLRERVRNDPNNFYTYSRNYLSLSVDPYDMAEERRREVIQEITLRGNRPPFRTIIPRSGIEMNLHPRKPPQCVLDDLEQERYHEQQTLKDNMKKATKQLKAFPNNEKEEFKQHLGKRSLFSLPEIREEDKVTSATLQKEILQHKKEQEDLIKQNLGNTFIAVKARTFKDNDQIEKHKGLLEDKVHKKGLMVTNSQIKNSKIDLKRTVEHPPSSMFSQEAFAIPQDPFTRKLDMTKVVTDQAFNLY